MWHLRVGAGDENRTHSRLLGRQSPHLEDTRVEPPAGIEPAPRRYQRRARPSSYRGSRPCGDHPLGRALGLESRWRWRQRESNPPRVACKASLHPSAIPVVEPARVELALLRCQRSVLPLDDGPVVTVRWNRRESNPHPCLAKAVSSHWTTTPSLRAGKESNLVLRIWNPIGHLDLRPVRRARSPGALQRLVAVTIRSHWRDKPAATPVASRGISWSLLSESNALCSFRKRATGSTGGEIGEIDGNRTRVSWATTSCLSHSATISMSRGRENRTRRILLPKQAAHLGR